MMLVRSVNTLRKLLSIQPSFGVQRRVSKFILSLDAGYHVSLVQGKVYLNSNQEAYLLDQAGDEINIDWSGLRVSAGVGIVF